MLLADLQATISRDSRPLQFAVLDDSAADTHGALADESSDIYLLVTYNGLVVNYDSSRYREKAIAALAGHLAQLIIGIAEDSQQSIGRLPLLTAAEKQRILGRWSVPESKQRYDVRRCVHQMFELWADRSPDATAVMDSLRALSYAEFNAMANRFAHCLISAGVKVGEFVGLCARPGMEMLAAVMGIYKSGGIYVPLDPEYPEARLHYQISDTQPRLILSESAVAGRLGGFAGRVIRIDADAISQFSSVNPQVDIELRQPAYINYTSGSTGYPKGVIGYHLGLANYLIGWGKYIDVNVKDRFLVRASFSYGAFHRQFLLPLVWGASTVLATDEERHLPLSLMEAVKRHAVTVFDFMPTSWRSANHALAKMIPSDRKELLRNNIRILVAHGETLDADVVAEWRELGANPTMKIYNVCGGTEVSCIAVSYSVPTGKLSSPVPIGHPVCNARIYILDDQLQPVPEGVWGEICYSGPNVSLGYLNQPQLTAEKFVSDPFSTDPEARMYRSGDIARYLPDGNLQHLKRQDLQVKLRGYRIELEEVEVVLNSHAGIERGVAEVCEYGPGDKRLIAYILPSEHLKDHDQLVASLRKLVKRTLPRYMCPAGYIVLDRLPLTSSGKLDRTALPAPDLEGRVGLGKLEPPHDQLEEQLAEIWKRVLDINAIGVDDNFFDIGGDSVLAVALLTEVELRTGHNLPLAALLYTPTIATMAISIKEQTWLEPDSTLVLLRPGGPKTPLFLMPHGGLHALCYRALAERLTPGRSVYGLEPKGIDGRLKADVGVDEQAGTYVAAIRRVRPHGPYLLGGLSGGGLIALEVAQCLRKSGEEVALVVMFDTYAHSYLVLKPPIQRFVSVLAWWMRARIGVYWGALKKLSVPFARFSYSLKARGIKGTWVTVVRKLSKVAKNNNLHVVDASSHIRLADRMEAENLKIRKRYSVRKFGRRLAEADQIVRLAEGYTKWFDRLALSLLKRSSKFFATVYAGGYYVQGVQCLPTWKQRLVHEYVHVWRAYRPAPYDGKVVLFRATQQPPGVVGDPLLGWGDFAVNGITVIDVAGTHTSIVKSAELAEKLQMCIDDCEGKACNKHRIDDHILAADGS